MILTEETKVLRFMFPWCFKKCWNPQILGPWVGISTILENFALNGWYFFRGRHGIEDWLIRIDLPQFVPVFLQKMRLYNALHVFLKSTHYSTILFSRVSWPIGLQLDVISFNAAINACSYLGWKQPSRGWIPSGSWLAQHGVSFGVENHRNFM